MASGAYTNGIKKIADGTIDLDTATLKVMLLKSSYTYNPDHTAVSSLSGDEIVATNYAGGFAGAGRKTATIALSNDDTNNRMVVTLTDLTWTTLGGATNDTVAAAALIYEVTNDAASIPIAYFDFTDTPTNGSNFTLDFASAGAGGNIQFNV